MIARSLDRVAAEALAPAALATAALAALAFGALMLAAQVAALRPLLAGALEGQGGAAPVGMTRAALVLGRTGLAKYLPGNVFHYVGRQMLARRFGWGQAAMAAASLAEIAVTVAAACAVALAGLALAGSQAAVLPALPAGVPLGVLLGLGVLAPLGAGLAAARLARLPRLAFLAPLGRMPAAAWAGGLAFYLGFLLCGVAGFALVLAALGAPVAAAGLGPVALAYAGGYAIGYLTPGAPGGVGIREALLVLMLGAALDPGLVAIAAVIQRLGYVAAEAGLWLWALGRMRGTPPVPMV